jgi:hypothetical protein
MEILSHTGFINSVPSQSRFTLSKVSLKNSTLNLRSGLYSMKISFSHDIPNFSIISVANLSTRPVMVLPG